MSNEEIVEQLENAIGLIKQDGRDWLDDRDIPVLEVCIKSLTALDKVRAEIDNALSDGMIHKKTVLGIIDKYKAESEDKE